MKNLKKIFSIAICLAFVMGVIADPLSGNNTEDKNAKTENHKLRKHYFSSGEVKLEFYYETGRYTTYYINGAIEEQGTWKNGMNTGEMLRYYPNGSIWQKFDFNEKGKREGEQLYFHENNNIEIRGIWVNGKINGTVQRFYENGELKSETNYVNGKTIWQCTAESW